MYPTHNQSTKYNVNQIKIRTTSVEELFDYLYALPDACSISVIESDSPHITEYVITLPDNTDMLETVKVMMDRMPCPTRWMFFIHLDHKNIVDKHLRTLYEEGHIEYLSQCHTNTISPNCGLVRYGISKFLHTEYGRLSA